MMSRRRFASALAAGVAGALMPRLARAASVPEARNIVLVHGLFADGSCWSEVIARLQAAGLNATSVQNPLTTLPEAVASAERVLARQDGPTVLVGHSFSGMIVTDAGVHFGAGLCGGARAGCRRRLRGLGQDLSDAAGDGRHPVRRR
jgi:pimeloyl-ACP methyl ester carboxylesterase